MIYTDKIHMMTDNVDLNELHKFAKKIGLNKCWFENKKGKYHPHYDVVNENHIPLTDKNGIKYIDKAINAGAQLVSKKRIVEINIIRKRKSPICKTHKPYQPLWYSALFDWAERKIKMGHVQKQCQGCMRYFFKCEF